MSGAPRNERPMSALSRLAGGPRALELLFAEPLLVEAHDQARCRHQDEQRRDHHDDLVRTLLRRGMRHGKLSLCR